MTLITKPGIYSMSAAEYHADPCETMSLSSTGARELVSDCPALFRYRREATRHANHFDVGTGAHLMVLEPEKFEEEIVLVQGYTKDGKPSDGYRTPDAKEQHDAAYAAGKVPLLAAEIEKVKAMRAAIWDDPVASMAFRDGRPEQSIFWKDEEFGIWCRTRPDFVPKHGRYLVDYKSANSANPDDFAKAILNYGYHQQAAWYLDGYEAVTGQRPEGFWFIVQMKEPPFLVSICRIDDASIHAGQVLNRYAKGVLAWCLEHDKWPGYQPRVNECARICSVSLPGFGHKKFEDGFEAGLFEPPARVAEKEAA